MPLNGFKSECDGRAPKIVSKDNRNPQKHIALNVDRNKVNHYSIDGNVICSGNRCDYLLMNEDKMDAYLIELKGSDLCHAAKQLEETENILKRKLEEYNIYYRIVANKCKTQEIETSEFKKYKKRWKNKLKYKSISFEENI